MNANNHISYEEQKRGLRKVLYDGIASQVMVNLSGGAFVISFGLLLGASNVVIGLIAAGPFLGNVFQIPAVLVVEKIRKRRLISIVFSLLTRAWLPIYALIPFFFGIHGLSILIVGIFIAATTGAFSNCAWVSWMRDFVPDDIRGRYFSKRMTLSLAVAMLLSLAAGGLIDVWQTRFPEQGIFVYSMLFLIAFASGIVGVFMIRATPEPPMGEVVRGTSLWEIIKVPLQDSNFRKMLKFTVSWALAFNLAIPFFVVYMLKRLGLSLSTVIVLSVISQFFHVAFLRIWGALSDKFSNKSVMQVGGIMLLICVIAWPFTTLPDIHVGTFPLLIIIHALMGVALAGVSIASFNIAFKLAPPQEATKYLALNNTLVSVAMGMGPIIGGILADLLEFMELAFTFRYLVPESEWTAYLLNLRGLDFLFLAAFILGLYALRYLALVQEKGEVPKGVVYQALISETRKMTRIIPSASGLSSIIYFPVSLVRKKDDKR
ncbi:MFS transporter [Candidatus Aerophobetes bacterium]|nr:MFS transporter [Candidatus Aerophobetes bacterium]